MLGEGCYYLSRLGLSYSELAKHFGITAERAEELAGSYSAKLDSGELTAGEFDRAFWEGVKKEAEGDSRVTFVSEKGFHHAWKSELEKLDSETLMSIFESSKDYLNADPNQKFLDYPPPQGYDPLMLEREIRRATSIVSELLERRWRGTQGRSEG